MNWIFYTFLNNISLVSKDFLLKKNTKVFGLLQFMATQNFFCSAITILIGFLVVGNIKFDGQVPLFALMAFLHAFAQTAKAKALAINMSLTSVASNFTPIFSITLAFLFLGENELFNIASTKGIMRICAIALFPIMLYLSSNGKKDVNGKTNLTWLLCIITQVLGHGITTFFYKYYLNVENLWSFLVVQRFFVSVFSFIFLLPKRKYTLSAPMVKSGLLNGALIVVSSITDKMAIILAPLSLYLLLQKPVQTILTTMGGLFIFREKKVLTRNQWLGLALGAILTILVIVSNIV
jgi:hypothetical protein